MEPELHHHKLEPAAAYLRIARAQVAEDYHNQAQDLSERIAEIEKKFKEGEYDFSHQPSPAQKGKAGIKYSLNRWIEDHPHLGVTADCLDDYVGQPIAGIKENFGELGSKIKEGAGVLWKKAADVILKRESIIWAEDELESLNYIVEELSGIANRYHGHLSFGGRGSFTLDFNKDIEEAVKKAGEENSSSQEAMKNMVEWVQSGLKDQFLKEGAHIGFAQEENRLRLPGYADLVRFMQRHSTDGRTLMIVYNPEGRIYENRKKEDGNNGTDANNITDPYENSKIRIDNLKALKKQEARTSLMHEIDAVLAEKHEALMENLRQLKQGYAVIDDVLQSASFLHYIDSHREEILQEAGDVRNALEKYIAKNISGDSAVAEKALEEDNNARARRNLRKDVKSAINTLWGDDQYAILTHDMLAADRVQGSRTFANILNASDELKDGLCDAAGQGKMMVLKIDNAITKEMSEQAMALTRHYHNILRVPLYTIAQMFSAGKDRETVLAKISEQVRPLGIYEHVQALDTSFAQWYKKVGISQETEEQKGLLKLIADLKEQYKENPQSLDLSTFKQYVNENLEKETEKLSLLYQHKARLFCDRFIEEREKDEKDVSGAVEYFVDRFAKMFRVQRFDPLTGKMQDEKDLEGIIDQDVLARSRDFIVHAYGQHSLVHGAQTVRAEGIQGIATTLLTTGLVYTLAEKLTHSQKIAMFVGANFDDVFAALIDTMESLTGTATEHGKRISRTIGGTAAGVATALIAGAYAFNMGDIDLGYLVIPTIVKNGITLGLVAAAGSLGALTGNISYYVSSYSMLEREGRVPDHIADHKGRLFKSRSVTAHGKVALGAEEEATRPFIQGMLKGAAIQPVAGGSLGLAGFLLGTPAMLYNPLSVAGVGFLETVMGVVSMSKARKRFGHWPVAPVTTFPASPSPKPVSVLERAVAGFE